MREPRAVPFTLLVVALLGAPAASRAQAGRPSPAPAPTVGEQEEYCPYELCAVRVHGTRLVRGWVGESVGRVGLLGGDLGILTEGSEEAARQARLSQRLQRRSTAAWVSSLPLLTLGLAAAESGTAQFSDGQIPVFSAAWVSGLYLLNRGYVFERKSRHALDRAIASYNQPFTPDVVPARPTLPVEPTRDPSLWLIAGGGAAGALAGVTNGQEGLYWGTLVGAGAGALLSALLVRW